jgi:hypothetical protein
MGFAQELSDFWVERRFRKIESGYLFYPNGPFGSGYEVTEEKKAELGAYLRHGGAWTAAIVINGGIIWWLTGNDAWAYAFILLLALPLGVYQSIRVRRMLSGARRSGRMSLSEFQQASAQWMTRQVALAWLIFSFLLAALALYLAYTSYVDGERGFFWFAIVCAIAPAILLAWLADIARVKLARANAQPS